MTDSQKKPELPPMLVRLRDERTGAECVYPKKFTPDHFSSALRYNADPTDVFVCAFAKSGTTWLQYIVWLIVHKGADFPTGKSLRHVIPMLEFDGCDVTKACEHPGFPRIVKTHFERKLVPYNKDAKYVYIARNPKDVVVSYMFHVRGFPSYEAPDLQMEVLFPTFAHGEVEFGNHTEHVAEWYAAREEPNVLFLLYEELKEDLGREVRKIATFLGKEYIDNLEKNGGELLHEIVRKTTFSSMSKAPNQKWVNSERKGTQFVRKGIVGDHKNHLTEENIQQLNNVMKEKGGKLGISHLWMN